MVRPLINDPNMIHFMIDIETLSTSPRAYVASLACSVFDPWGQNVPTHDSIYRACVGLKDKSQLMRKKDPETIWWWLNQDIDAISTALKQINCDGLHDMIGGLWNYIQDHGKIDSDITLWFRGCSFDPAILRDIYMENKWDQPWKFWNEMDVRVLENLALIRGIPKWKGGEELRPHDPVDDVIAQIRQTQHYLRAEPGGVSFHDSKIEISKTETFLASIAEADNQAQEITPS